MKDIIENLKSLSDEELKYQVLFNARAAGSRIKLDLLMNEARRRQEYIATLDIGTGESESVFTIFKDGKIVKVIRKLWVAKLWLFWCKFKGITIVQET